MDFDSHLDEEYVQCREWYYQVKDNIEELKKRFPPCGKVPPGMLPAGLLPKGKIMPRHPKASTSAANQPLRGGGALFLRYGWHQKRFRSWQELNPSKASLGELSTQFNLLYRFGGISWFQRARITYLEVAADIDNVRFSDYIYLHPSLAYGENCRGEGSDLCGARTGKYHFFCYDKRNQLREFEKKPDLGHDRLRIELRLKGDACPRLRHLDDLGNPFKDLLVVERQMVESTDAPGFDVLRQALASGESVQAAFASLDKQTRKTVLAVAKNFQPEWWNPEKFWETFPQALAWRSEVMPYWLKPAHVPELLEVLRTTSDWTYVKQKYPDKYSPLWKFLQ